MCECVVFSTSTSRINNLHDVVNCHSHYIIIARVLIVYCGFAVKINHRGNVLYIKNINKNFISLILFQYKTTNKCVMWPLKGTSIQQVTFKSLLSVVVILCFLVLLLHPTLKSVSFKNNVFNGMRSHLDFMPVKKRSHLLLFLGTVWCIDSLRFFKQ